MRWILVQHLGSEEFRRLTGVKKETFKKMVLLLGKAREEKSARGGRKTKLCVEDMLLMALEYLREYRTYFHISVSYGLSESNTYKIIRWIEDTLIKSKVFSLPGRKALLKSDVDYAVILVDASETPIQRPKKKQRYYYSGKKKRHTLKSQVVIDKGSKKVICTDFSNGKRHDFRLFKESGIRFHPQIRVLTDTGYQGLHKIHANSALPKKENEKAAFNKRG